MTTKIEMKESGGYDAGNEMILGVTEEIDRKHFGGLLLFMLVNRCDDVTTSVSSAPKPIISVKASLTSTGKLTIG
jgi:hypothetical protein